MGLKQFLVEGLSEVARLSRELLGLRKSLVAALQGRDVSELLGDEYLAEAVLGGLRVEDWRRPRYPQGSLAGFYHDILGIGVDDLKLLLARLSDGLPLRLATRGIRVVAEDTEPLRLIAELERLSAKILEALGRESAIEASSREPREQHVAVEVLGELLNTLPKTLPPYHEEAQLLFAAGNGSLPRKLYESLPEDTRRELEELGLSEEEKLPGCPDDTARCLLGAGKDTVIKLYYCYTLTAIRLLQDRHIRAYYNAPDPLKDLLDALGEKPLTDPLLQELAQYARKAPCLPRESCSTQPPCLPTGYVAAEIGLELRDIIVQLPAQRETTIGEILEKLYPQLCSGVARLKNLENRVELSFIAKLAL